MKDEQTGKSYLENGNSKREAKEKASFYKGLEEALSVKGHRVESRPTNQRKGSVFLQKGRGKRGTGRQRVTRSSRREKQGRYS